jgi:hypothetical protein
MFDKIPFLGHIITNGGIDVDVAKVKYILQWTIPQSVTEIQSFFGSRQILSMLYWSIFQNSVAYDLTIREGEGI